MKVTKLVVVAALAMMALGSMVMIPSLGQPIAVQAQDAAIVPAAPQSLPPPWLSDADVADAPYGAAPNVDGRIAPGEYAGAHKLTFPTYGGDLEVLIRQDAITLYIAFDSPDTTPYPYYFGGGTGPAFQVFLDTLNDKSTAPQSDDYRLTIDKGGVTSENQGTGSGWGPAGSVSLWNAAVSTVPWGWQGEFAISFTKLGITQTGSISIGLGLAEVWTPSWPHDWYWPSGGYYLDPSTWGNLTSSSNWGTFYWKPGPWEDYAPSGLPDFDQRQSGWFVPGGPGGQIWTHCGPVAAANSLWWFDSKFETPDHAPPTISDTYRLVRAYGALDDHDPQNVIPLVDDLANNYFGTNQGGILGTNVISMFHGTQRYLRDHGLWDDYVVTLVISPSFQWVAEEVQRSEDVILLLGFWQQDMLGTWHRVGGHFVSVAGIDLGGMTPPRIAFSDPLIDNAETGGPGRVLSGTLIPHQPIPGHPSNVHNDAGNVSHDVYVVVPTNSPGGTWGPELYPWEKLEANFGANPHPEFPTEPYLSGLPIQVEVEFALAVSPYDWKASGEWVGTSPVSGTWQPWADYAPNGIPDFDQKQDNWKNQLTGRWSFCGPAAAADSLWWFDSKFEPHPITPTTTNDGYPMVQPYATMDPHWDDHDPRNVENLATTQEFVDELAYYFNTDGMSGSGIPHAGTVITDLYTGIVQYITDHNLRQGYVITMVNKPEFWWVAEEVEVSEDVILLLGFWQFQGPGPGWVRLGGHYVTLPGVDKQGGYVAFSDPWFDRIEQTWPYAGVVSPPAPPGVPWYTGRVANGWLIQHPVTHTGVYTLHNDAGNVSHDIYRAVTTDSPGGVWGPLGYVTSWSQIENFWGQNGQDDTPTPTGDPIQTEVEWAVAVSPVADVWITKTVTPAVMRHGEHITFTLTFSNGGSLPAQNVVITDALPSQLIGASWSAWVSNGGSVTARGGTSYVWDVPDLAWQEWGIITVTGQISATDLNRSVVNTATIATSSVEQYQVPQLANSASASFTIQNPDIGVTPASLSVTLAEGASATRFITISNTGGAALNWGLAEQPAVTWLSETPTAGSIAPAGSTLVTVTFDATGLAAGTYTTTLRITSDDPDENPVDVPVSLTVIRYGVDLQPANSSVTENPGETVVYTLTLYNTGSVTDTYAISGAVSGQAWTTNWPAMVGPVAGGGNAQFNVTVQIPEGASSGSWSRVVITVTSKGDDKKWDTSVLTTTAYTGVITRGVVIAPHTASDGGRAGSTVTYTLRVTNTGNVADLVTLSHTKPPTWTLSYSANPLSLEAGQGTNVQVYVGIPASAPGGITATITITAALQGDPTKTDTAALTTSVLYRFLYLPLVMRNY